MELLQTPTPERLGKYIDNYGIIMTYSFENINGIEHEVFPTRAWERSKYYRIRHE